MLIVDGQIHLWEKGTPSAHHRQEPYSAEQAIAGMDEAGVDRALIHPVLWDPQSNELAIEAVRKYPARRPPPFASELHPLPPAVPCQGSSRERCCSAYYDQFGDQSRFGDRDGRRTAGERRQAMAAAPPREIRPHTPKLSIHAASGGGLPN